MSRISIVFFLVCLIPGLTYAVPTEITVRVLSKDAKFIGTGMGGVSIRLVDVNSGELLAEGKTSGSTGDTATIMLQPRSRGAPLSSSRSASFTATLDLDMPVKMQVIAEGPLSNTDSSNRVSATQWVVPGKHITGGDGWLLEMPGLSVTAEFSALSDGRLSITAKVTMMCGCPIEPDGLWDANDYEVTALVRDSEGNSRTTELNYAGRTSMFNGSMKLDDTGPVEVVVYAYNAGNGNTGVDHAQLQK